MIYYFLDSIYIFQNGWASKLPWSITGEIRAGIYMSLCGYICVSFKWKGCKYCIILDKLIYIYIYLYPFSKNGMIGWRWKCQGISKALLHSRDKRGAHENESLYELCLAGLDLLLYLFSRTTVLQSMKLGIDVNRHKEVIVKAIAALLLLLLKHFKLNHVYQVRNVPV